MAVVPEARLRRVVPEARLRRVVPEARLRCDAIIDLIERAMVTPLVRVTMAKGAPAFEV